MKASERLRRLGGRCRTVREEGLYLQGALDVIEHMGDLHREWVVELIMVAREVRMHAARGANVVDLDQAARDFIEGIGN